jgi:hypothetical protein
MRTYFTLLLLWSAIPAEIKAQKTEPTMAYSFTLSKPIDLDLNKNFIFHLGTDDEGMIYARRYSRGKGEDMDILKFDTNFTLLAKAPFELPNVEKNKKQQVVENSVSKYGINTIYYEEGEVDKKMTFFMKTWDKNLKSVAPIELGSLPILKKSPLALMSKGQGI